MPIIVVEVMPKPELLDPAGKAVAGTLNRLGKSEFSGVRIGKRIELSVDGEITDTVLADVRELADEGEPVERLELDLFPASGKHERSANLHQLILQQALCQCLRAARSARSPSTPSARQATRCAVPGSITREHPGHVYGLTACAAERGCTVHSAPRRTSVRFHPARSQSKDASPAAWSRRRRLDRGTGQYQPTDCECPHAPHGVP